MAVVLFFSASCWAKPTNQLVVLTTFRLEAIKPILEAFKQDHPELQFTILHRRETSGLRLLEQADHDIDLVISSSLSLFSTLSEQKRLLPLNELNYDSAFQQQQFMQQTLKNVAVFGYSGYGIMWNQDYLTMHNLPEPDSWESLTEPQYFRHLVMSSPARSGTTHIMVENILQQYGWKKGWQIILQIGGNLSSVSARSYGVSDTIARGLAGIGPIIDSYAHARQKIFPFIGFKYQANSPLLPSYAAAVDNINPSPYSIAFIQFLLSDEMQQNLSTSAMNKYALSQAMSQPFEVIPINQYLMQKRASLVKQLFEQTINQQLIRLNQAWQLIHEIKKLPHLSQAEHRQFNLALKLASTPPISEAQAKDPLLLDAISMTRTDFDTMKYTNQWRRLMSEQLDQAIAICERLLDAHERRRRP
ncbi:iron ABC transporter substrate-binding protein [Photobacterium aphoticum]|uniref:Phosphoglycerate transport regulatory protein PgtC n=1 Tax=Photobacterium aphoticum TaxID=754436 RepID=A0A090R0V9_9GAMM|nr:phosphoglycerate transport regulatory protein PgtC [Photobacterium aphoticum]GHA64024.1 iron ABC transporter substrate-binding protein [Photobacterium aphoticum]